MRRVPYRLPELASSKGTVFVPEGEKHVDRLIELGLRATTNPGGAGKWRADYSEFLRGADVVILPDNDVVGRKHGEAIARSLSGVAARVCILALPGLKEKGDVIDWLDAGGNKDELLRLAELTPDWQPSQANADSPPKLSALLKSAADLQHKQFEPLRWIVPEYLPEGLTLLAGKPKIGKSFLALDVAIAVADGGSCLGERCEKGDVLALFLEDNDRRLQRRLTTMLGAHTEAWPRRLAYATNWPRLDCGGIDRIRDWIMRASEPRLVIIDILERVRQREGDKRKPQYSADYDALAALQTLSAEAQLSVLVLHHQRKMGADDLIDTLNGTEGLGGAVDAVLILGKDDSGKFLYGRGRDLEEFSIAVRQDEHRRWQALGDKPEVQTSPERGRIIAVLTRSDRAMSVEEIASATDMKKANVKNLLSKLHGDGGVQRVATGLYRLAPVQPDFDLGEPPI